MTQRVPPAASSGPVGAGRTSRPVSRSVFTGRSDQGRRARPGPDLAVDLLVVLVVSGLVEGSRAPDVPRESISGPAASNRPEAEPATVATEGKPRPEKLDSDRSWTPRAPPSIERKFETARERFGVKPARPRCRMPAVEVVWESDLRICAVLLRLVQAGTKQHVPVTFPSDHPGRTARDPGRQPTRFEMPNMRTATPLACLTFGPAGPWSREDDPYSTRLIFDNCIDHHLSSLLGTSRLTAQGHGCDESAG